MDIQQLKNVFLIKIRNRYTVDNTVNKEGASDLRRYIRVEFSVHQYKMYKKQIKLFFWKNIILSKLWKKIKK